MQKAEKNQNPKRQRRANPTPDPQPTPLYWFIRDFREAYSCGPMFREQPGRRFRRTGAGATGHLPVAAHNGLTD